MIEKQCQHSHKNQIERSRVEQRPVKPGCHYELGFPYDLDNHYDPCQRRILDKRDDLVCSRRHDALDDLQKNDSEKYLRLGHAENLAGFVLAARNAFNPASEYLAEIASIVNCKSDERRLKPERLCQRHAKSQPRDIKDYYDLQHQRRAAYDPYKGLYKISKRRKP